MARGEWADWNRTGSLYHSCLAENQNRQEGLWIGLDRAHTSRIGLDLAGVAPVSERTSDE